MQEFKEIGLHIISKEELDILYRPQKKGNLDKEASKDLSHKQRGDTNESSKEDRKI